MPGLGLPLERIWQNFRSDCALDISLKEDGALGKIETSINRSCWWQKFFPTEDGCLRFKGQGGQIVHSCTRLSVVMILRCSPKRAIGQYKDHVIKKWGELKSGLFCSFATESLGKSIVEVEKQSWAKWSMCAIVHFEVWRRLRSVQKCAGERIVPPHYPTIALIRSSSRFNST